MDYKRTTLKNGVRLLTAEVPQVRSASVAFFFAVGSRYEQDDVAGVSHFIEHMLFKGSQRYPTARLISEAVEGVGGSINGSTGKELTGYTVRVPAECLPVVFDVLADMIRHPLFDPVEIEKERGVIIEELSATQDDPQEWVYLLADEVMWPGLPLGRDDAGTVASVSRLQRQQMLEYMHLYYRPNTCVVSIAGNIDHQQVVRLADDLFSQWEPGDSPKWAPSLPPCEAAAVRMVKKETEQTNLCLATLGTAYASPDYLPVLLINALLGDGMSSRLFQSIREEQGLAYDIGSYFNSYYETGNFVISAGVDPSRAQDTVKAIVHELQRLCDEPVPVEELERIKAYVRGSFLLGLEGTHQIASWLGSQECLYNSIRDIDDLIAKIMAITPSDLQRVARICFAPEWRRLSMIGPDDPQQAEHFGRLLAGV
ncbi:MAG TPA: pitrilysin family protein [Ktedonobacteraceae bacterium]